MLNPKPLLFTFDVEIQELKSSLENMRETEKNHQEAFLTLQNRCIELQSKQDHLQTELSLMVQTDDSKLRQVTGVYKSADSESPHENTNIEDLTDYNADESVITSNSDTLQTENDTSQRSTKNIAVVIKDSKGNVVKRMEVPKSNSGVLSKTKSVRETDSVPESYVTDETVETGKDNDSTSTTLVGYVLEEQGAVGGQTDEQASSISNNNVGDQSQHR